MDAIDDVLNAADMAVGNPEFLDLDMEGMFWSRICEPWKYTV
jgi:mediator of RNA polymerase II transcription subunit 5